MTHRVSTDAHVWHGWRVLRIARLWDRDKIRDNGQGGQCFRVRTVCWALSHALTCKIHSNPSVEEHRQNQSSEDTCLQPCRHRGSAALNPQLADIAHPSIHSSTERWQVSGPVSGLGRWGGGSVPDRYTDGFVVDIPLVLQGPVKSLPLPGSPPRWAHSHQWPGGSRCLAVGEALPWLPVVVKLFLRTAGDLASGTL